jgi:hypothetical protein
MTKEKLSRRQRKRRVLDLLRHPDYAICIKQICRLPYRQVVNPLFSFLYSLDEQVKWRAVSAMGAVVCRLAEKDMEQARIIMRRLMWNLNDESGGIGWGSPEAMGEAMALNENLAEEYAAILVSYLDPDGNYLEHEDLQKGALWGVGRLAHSRPQLVADAAVFLAPFLEAEDPGRRGLAAWAAAALPGETVFAGLAHLKDDDTNFKIYIDGRLLNLPVNRFAKRA